MRYGGTAGSSGRCTSSLLYRSPHTRPLSVLLASLPGGVRPVREPSRSAVKGGGQKGPREPPRDYVAGPGPHPPHPPVDTLSDCVSWVWVCVRGRSPAFMGGSSPDWDRLPVSAERAVNQAEMRRKVRRARRSCHYSLVLGRTRLFGRRSEMPCRASRASKVFDL